MNNQFSYLASRKLKKWMKALLEAKNTSTGTSHKQRELLKKQLKSTVEFSLKNLTVTGNLAKR
jgi:hypothetical protein